MLKKLKTVMIMELLMMALIVICGIHFFIGNFLNWLMGEEIVFP